jgi:Fic family protein
LEQSCRIAHDECTLAVVARNLRKSTRRLHSILKLGKRTPNARSALNALYSRPVMTASQLEEALGINTPTANALIRDLVELGIFIEVTGQKRWRTYAFDRYLRLFLS